MGLNWNMWAKFTFGYKKIQTTDTSCASANIWSVELYIRAQNVCHKPSRFKRTQTYKHLNPYGFGDYETKVSKCAIIDVLTFLYASQKLVWTQSLYHPPVQRFSIKLRPDNQQKFKQSQLSRHRQRWLKIAWFSSVHPCLKWGQCRFLLHHLPSVIHSHRDRRH